MHPFLESEAALSEFLQAFEDCSLPADRWTHAAHIAGGTVYLRRYGTHALAHIRTNIQRFNAAKGGPPTAYHETITIFWLAILDEATQGTAFANDLAAVRFTVDRFGDDRKLHTDYYSYDVVKSDEARLRWVAPDIRPLPVLLDLTS